MKKQSVISAIKDFPKDFYLDELLEKLIFIEKIEKGLKQLNEGKIIEHDKVKHSVKEW